MTTLNPVKKIEEILVAAWTIKDVLVVTLCILGGGIIFYFSLLFLFGDSTTTFRLARYVGSLLTIFIPLFWINKRYGLTKEALGLKKGNLSLPLSVLIGIVTGLFYSFLIKSTLFRYGSVIDLNIPNLYIYLILVPFSVSVFVTIVLTPVGEEIMFRGFMYGYFRKKMGIIYGLLFQAFLFSLIHFKYIYGNTFKFIVGGFLAGLILGILYEKTGSIYPSIICHGTINYLSIIFKFIQL